MRKQRKQRGKKKFEQDEHAPLLSRDLGAEDAKGKGRQIEAKKEKDLEF